MDSANYDPQQHLVHLFDSPELLSEIPDLLAYTNQYKLQLQNDIDAAISDYDTTSSVPVDRDIVDLITKVKEMKQTSEDTRASISKMTNSIRLLDQYKKNLVLSMTILKRLQMLIGANESLIDAIPNHNYHEIYQLLTVIKQLIQFFQPYKSIDEINQLSLSIQNTQNKLVDDIFIDFEELVNHTSNIDHGQLKYGCEILELIDKKYKDKLLSWYYNYHLKDIKTIFNNYDEAGSLENLSRRYIYFNNILSSIQGTVNTIFPLQWNIEVEFCKLFCQLTKQDLISLLSVKRTTGFDSHVILDNLHHTIDFEKSIQEKFPSADFNQTISSVFEPYLTVWVQEQDKVLQGKFLEYLSLPQLPNELQAKDQQEFVTILKVNNVPNIANSSTDLFKTFQKILTQILKLSNGVILVDLCKLFIKYLFDYNSKVLSPMLPINNPDLLDIEAIKYLTMLLNTGDYVINNMDDLSNKFTKLINPQLESKIPSFDAVKDGYYKLINKSIASLVTKVAENTKPVWRQFVNQNWQNMESVNDTSIYMQDLITIIHQDNIEIAFPLIIRDSYVRNVSDRLVELVIYSLVNHLVQIKPLSVLMVEQLLLDVNQLKDAALGFTLFSDANYSHKVGTGVDSKDISKSYEKFVNMHFNQLESLLKVLMAPVLPVEDFIEQYFELIGDISVPNFMKVLFLKSIESNHQDKYIENFKLQLSVENESLIKSSPLITRMEIDVHPRETEEKSATPELKSPKLLPGNFPTNKINLNIERNLRELAINGENITKFNENFKNFGKFFRKDDRN
jgi:hypothetical protein